MSADRISELVSVYRSHKPDIRPYEAIPDLLERLHERLQLGLLSDGFLPAQRLKLDALEIERFFDAVVFTEEIARDVWKPSPVGFEAIREKLGVEHQGCAYVADNPAKDFVTPNQLGWLTVQYLQPGQVHSHKPPPDGGAPQVSVDCPDRLYEALLARD
jgi:putative hydrolase of the HAD superfamily